MSQRNGLSKRSEKGLLTPDNCVVALIDHQPQMLFGVSSTDRQSVINNTPGIREGGSGIVWGEQLVQQMLARKASGPTKTVSQIHAPAHYKQ